MIKSYENEKSQLKSNWKSKLPKIFAVMLSIVCLMTVFTTMVFAEELKSNTDSIDNFVTFICDWLKKIGAVVAMVGGVMFALGWQREDADGKTRGLQTLMAGFMVVAIGVAPGIFGL